MGKAVGSGYDGFEGKKRTRQPFLDFWMPGWTTYLRLLFSSLSPTTLFEPTYPLALALYPLIATPKQSHRSNYIAISYCLTTCYLHFSTADSLALLSASLFKQQLLLFLCFQQHSLL